MRCPGFKSCDILYKHEGVRDSKICPVNQGVLFSGCPVEGFNCTPFVGDVSSIVFHALFPTLQLLLAPSPSHPHKTTVHPSPPLPPHAVTSFLTPHNITTSHNHTLTPTHITTNTNTRSINSNCRTRLLKLVHQVPFHLVLAEFHAVGLSPILPVQIPGPPSHLEWEGGME